MQYPSVTEVINPWMDWSKIPPGILQYAADRGTIIHDLCHRHTMGEFVVTEPEFQPYFDSFKRWFELMVDEVILAEARLCDPIWNYSGQIDLLATLKDGRLSLIDIKTPVLSQRSWKVQLAGYNNLCAVNGHKLDCSGSLQLSPQGKMAKMTWCTDGAGDFNQFLTDLKSYRFYHYQQ